MRIGLLTPYTGTNLGDGAIFIAAMAALRARAPNVQLVGITLDPDETTKRHGIPAVPIVGMFVPFYSNALFVPNKTHGNLQRSHLRHTIKNLPFIGAPLKFLVTKARTHKAGPAELRNLYRSWKVARSIDLLLISGGGQLDEEFGGPWGHPYAMFRWAGLARMAGARVAFASVGAQFMNQPLSRFFIRSALAMADYRSYRDAGSKRLVESWSFTKDDPCVPDLAFSLPNVRLAPLQGPLCTGATIGISPIVYGHSKLWPTKRPEVYERYFRCLVDFSLWLLAQGYKLALFHSSGSDRFAVDDLLEELRKRTDQSAQQWILRPITLTVEQFFQEVGAIDLIVASRLHGVLMSHMLGKPVLAISFDRKVDAHMCVLGQTKYSVDIHHFDVLDLINRFKLLAVNSELECQRISQRVGEFRSALQPQYDKLVLLAERGDNQ